MNRPKRPVLITIGRPHFGQISSVGSSLNSSFGSFSSADAVIFQRLDQRGFGETRRRFGEVLLGIEPAEAKRFVFVDSRQAFGVGGGGRFVAAFFVEFGVARKLQDAARRAEHVVLSSDIYRRLVEDRRRHLRGY